MLHKTKGIVLHHLKYGDTSLISTIYTSSHGRMPFLVQGVYKRKAKFHPSFFQPLTLLNMEVYVEPRRELQRIRELSVEHPFTRIPFDNTKSTIALFLSEILYKTLKEEESNPSLFEFLYHAIQFLDVNVKGSANFHMVFLATLTRFLGFYPINNYNETDCLFDKVNGRFSPSLSVHSDADLSASKWMSRLLDASFENLESLSMNHKNRNDLTSLLLEFYSLHLSGMGAIRSHSVLQSVFDD